MTNIAAIDIGTNSTRLLVASVTGKKITTLVREMKITRLGKNIESGNIILEDSIKKTITILTDYLETCRQHKVKTIRAVGTSVLRRADNSECFLKKVYKQTGLKVEVISGAEEAKLGFEGVAKSLKYSYKNFRQSSFNSLKEKHQRNRITVLDIGGGSSEIVSGSADGMVSSIKSIDLGSVTISEKFLKKDIPEAGEISLMNDFIREVLKKELGDAESYKDAPVIGVAGTVSTIGSIFMEMETYDRDKLNGLFLSVRDIEKIFRRLTGLALVERKKIKGLQPERADIIIGGTAILLVLLDYIKAESMLVSEHDILDGIIYSSCNF